MLNPDFNFVYWLGGFFALSIVIFFARKYFGILGHIWEILKLVFNYFYVVLIPIPVIYLMYYYLFFEANKTETYIFNSIDLIKDLKNLSFWFFTAGAFSAATKIISNLKIFKSQFESIILSDKFKATFKEILLSNEFDSQLTKKFEILTFSQENLNKQPNLDKIWKDVTLCKYEKQFPQLMEKLREKIENDLFEENNLSYYYKNLRIQVKFELLENDIVKITETSTSTIISNTESEIDIEFFVTSHENDGENVYSKIIPSKTKINGEALDEDFFKDTNPIKEGEYYKKILFEEVGGYDENMKSFEDWEFWIRILNEKSQVYKIPEFMFFYRKHDEGSLSNSFKTNPKFYFSLYDYVYEKHKGIYKKYFPNPIIAYNENLILTDFTKKIKNNILFTELPVICLILPSI